MAVAPSRGNGMKPPKRTLYRACLRAALLILCALLSAATLHAEPAAGRITGRVLDPQGAPVSQADVKLVNAAGTTVGDARSDDQGRFALSDVDPGDYQLVAESPAFVTVVQNVSLGRGQPPQVSLQFQQLVSVQQQVTVVASAPVVADTRSRAKHHHPRPGAGR